MSKRSDVRSIALGFGGEQYLPLACLGLCGAAPLGVWLLSIAVPLRPALIGLFVVPWLVPCLVLWARQPRGARIAWNDEAVTEWDGPWKRAVIPWKDLELAQLVWKLRRSISVEGVALQLFDKAGSAVITVWNIAPDAAPLIRRRLCAGNVTLLQDTLAERDIASTRTPDWSLAADPDRPLRRRSRWLGRLGYAFAIFAPLLVPGAGVNQRSPLISLCLAAAAVGLLTFRALPVFRELRALRIRMRGAPTSADPEGERAARRLRLRATLLEALARGGMAVAPAVSTGFAYVYFP